MVSTSIKRTDGRDRLSELPDEVLVHILSYLPITDAVKTVLIRRFGYLWTLIPSLNFDTALFKRERRFGEDGDDYIPYFASFVRNVLILHKRIPIEKFHLRFYNIVVYDDDYESFASDITTWIRFAIDREVKKLRVQFEYEVDGNILPRCVFTSQFLVELELVNCGIGRLTHVQMGSLRTLSLVDVDVGDVEIKKLICGSPSLQELVLNNAYGVNKLQFTAPNIEKLDLGYYYGLLDCPNLKFLNIHSHDPWSLPLKEVVLVDVSSVREVNIGSCYVLDRFVEFVKKLCNAEVFKFSDKGFQSSISKELVIPQTSWKHLHIKTQLQADKLLCLCKVLTRSPLLEELVCTYLHDSDITHDHDMNSLELPSGSLKQLKTVTMRGYKVPCQGLLRLAEYLLKISVTLEKMVISPSKTKNQVEALEELKFVKQLLSFPRASTNARVIYGSDIY